MRRKNPLIAFYVRSCVIGFLLAAVFTAGLVGLNVGRLGYLVTHVDGGYLAAFLLWFFNGIVFSGAQAAVSVLLMAEREDRPRGGSRRRAAAPVAVRAR